MEPEITLPIEQGQPTESFLNIEMAAALLGMTTKALTMRVYHNQIPYHHWGKRIVLLRSEIEEFVRRLPGVSVDEAIANAGIVGDAEKEE